MGSKLSLPQERSSLETMTNIQSFISKTSCGLPVPPPRTLKTFGISFVTLRI